VDTVSGRTSVTLVIGRKAPAGVGSSGAQRDLVVG
jgi:hypothetical protein